MGRSSVAGGGGGGSGVGCRCLARLLLIGPLPATPKVVGGHGWRGEGRQLPFGAVVFEEEGRRGVSGGHDVVDVETQELQDGDVRNVARCAVLGDESHGEGIEEAAMLPGERRH